MSHPHYYPCCHRRRHLFSGGDESSNADAGFQSSPVPCHVSSGFVWGSTNQHAGCNHLLRSSLRFVSFLVSKCKEDGPPMNRAHANIMLSAISERPSSSFNSNYWPSLLLIKNYGSVIVGMFIARRCAKYSPIGNLGKSRSVFPPPTGTPGKMSDELY
eukprot:scaffold56665_cov49-Attheya_sp.AAC.1